MYAAAYGSLDAMKLLFGRGRDVNAKNAFDVTALCGARTTLQRSLAGGKGRERKCALQARPDALIIAPHTMQLRDRKTADRERCGCFARTQRETSALHEAADANDTESVRLLLAKGADVNAKDAFGNTPFDVCGYPRQREVMKLFLAKGADVNVVTLPKVHGSRMAPSRSQLTALHLAAISVVRMR